MTTTGTASMLPVSESIRTLPAARMGKSAIGKSRGGATSKIHARVDALGTFTSVHRDLRPGSRQHASSDSSPGADASAFIADKAYDSDAMRFGYRRQEGQSRDSILQESCAGHPLRCAPLQERQAVDNFFARIKRSRRVATRHAKLLSMYEGVILLAAIVRWLS